MMQVASITMKKRTVQAYGQKIDTSAKSIRMNTKGSITKGMDG